MTLPSGPPGGSPSRGPSQTPGPQTPDTGSLRPPQGPNSRRNGTPGSARSTPSYSPVSPNAQGSKASMHAGGGGRGGGAASEQGSMGAKLEDEMNNDHLQKLQEIFEVRNVFAFVSVLFVCLFVCFFFFSFSYTKIKTGM